MTSDADPLSYERNAVCWCGSGRKYKTCHGRRVGSEPGAPVPADTDESIFISPTTALARGALQLDGGPVPIVMPDPGTVYVPAPHGISELAERLASVRATESPPSLSETGSDRFAELDDLGLDAESTVDAQVSALPEAALHELLNSTLRHGRLTLDALRLDADARASIWAPETDVLKAVGRSLLWADHYLTADPLAELALGTRAFTRSDCATAVKSLLRVRRLVEIGLVVPVAENLARAATVDAVAREVREDALNPDLMRWLDSQLEMEGPTAREVLLLGARDDLGRLPHMEMLGRIEVDVADDGRFRTPLLGRFDPQRDYGPWIQQTREKQCARLLQSVHEQIAVAEAFGAHYVAPSPFRARLLREKQRLAADVPTLTAMLDVPMLPTSDPQTLARIAANEESVAAMRSALKRALRDVETLDVGEGVHRLQNLVDDLVEEAERELRRSMRRSQAWAAAVPGGVTGVGLLLGVSPVLATVISAVSAVAPYLASRGDQRAKPAWMFVAADRQGRRGRRSR